MIGFVDSQTKWYTDKTDRFNEIKIEILKCTPEGRYKLAVMRINALEKVQQVFRMTTAMVLAFSKGIDLKPFQEITKSLNSLNEICLEDARKKKEDLCKVQDTEVHMGSREVQGVRPGYQIFPGLTYEQYFDERKKEWIFSGEKLKIYQPNESEEDYQKRQKIYLQQKSDRREGVILADLGRARTHLRKLSDLFRR